MHIRSMLAAAMLTVASPAFASTIVQDLAARQGSGDETPFDITGAPFDPALGTLTAVTATLTGVLEPTISYGGATGTLPSTGILATSYSVYTEPPSIADYFTGTLPTQTAPLRGSGLPRIGGGYAGMPAPVDLMFNFPLLSPFVSSAPGPSVLALFGFNSIGANVVGGGSLSDGTRFDGTFALTYTYDAAAVPEPASLALLGGSLFGGLSLTRRRRRREAA